MDKKLLESLNDLQYDDNEIEEIERQANSQEIDMDKYFIRNAALKRKLAVSAVDEFVRKHLIEGEIVEKSVLVESGIISMPSLNTWGAPVHYYIILTNKRLTIVGLDYNYKVVTSHMKDFKDIEGIIEKQKVEMTYGVGLTFKYALKFKETAVTLRAVESKEVLEEIIRLLRSRGVKDIIDEKDRDIDYSRLVVGIYASLIILFILLAVNNISKLL